MRAARIATLCLFLLSSLPPLVAQSNTGAIAGTVKDPSGAVVAGARVKLTDTDKGITVRTATTGSGGEFSLPELPIGTYSLTVEAPNFKTFVQRAIVLHVSDRLTLAPVLTIGGPKEEITAEVRPVEVNLQNATATGVVTGTEIRQLSLQARNYVELVFTVPGTSNSSNGGFFPAGTASMGSNVVTIQVNGGRREENNFTVDGADNVDRGANLTLLTFPSVDAIAEFRVLRGVYDAESGRSAGAQVNAITRSGTSTLHGSAYEFFRNDVLNANAFFNNRNGVDRTKLRYNNFGGTFGGPVWIPKVYEHRDKTFFFFSEEARRVVTYSNRTATVPLQGMINGQFQHVVCTRFANASGSAGPCQSYGTAIAQSQWDAIAAAYVKDIFALYPSPNAGTPSSPFTYLSALPSTLNFRDEMLKIDHIVSNTVTISGKVLRDTTSTQQPGTVQATLPIPNIATTTSSLPGRQYSISGTAILRPTLLIEGGYRYSYGAIISRSLGVLNLEKSPHVKSAIASTLPFANTVGQVPGVTIAGITSGLTVGTPYDDVNVNHTLYGNVAKVHGTHTLTFGAIFYHYNKHENQLGSPNNGVYAFDSVNAPTAATRFQGTAVCTGTAAAGGTCPFSAEQAWANFLLGQVSTFSQADVDLTANIFDNQVEYYAQDTWRARPRFTITYGMRHSFFRQPTDASGPGGTSRLSNFAPALWRLANAPCITSSGLNDVTLTNGTPTRSACNPNYSPLNGYIYADPPNYHGFVGMKSPFGSKVGKEYNRAVAFRVGFAWDPWGTGVTSVRAGYGMFYDNGLEFGNPELNIGGNPGFVTNVGITRSTMPNPAGTTTVAGTQTPPLIGARLPINYRSPHTQQWSLDLQRQMGSWFVDVGYFGNNGIHLPGYVDLSQPAPGAYLECSTVNKCFAGPVTVPANGVDLSTGCPTSQPCVNSMGNTTKLNVLRTWTGYGPEGSFEDIYTSNYHSLQLQVKKKFAETSLINLAYTWSHGLTTDPADRGTGGASLPQAPTNIMRNNYGPTIGDRRHILTASFVWELPWRSRKGLAAHLLGGWQFSGIQTFQTGLPLTASIGNGGCSSGTGASCVDAIGSACFGPTPIGCRVNQVGDPNSGAPRSYSSWFNATALQPALLGQTTIPTERPGAIRGPGFWNTDLSLFKDMHFTRRLTAQFRLESFNTFNHTNPICCASLLFNSTLFNQVTSTRDPRILQLAMKLEF